MNRDEAEKLLDEYRFACEVMSNGVGFSSASREALIKMSNDAREACLSAMLRPEAAPSTRPEPQAKTLWVFLQQRPRDKQPFPLVYVDQQLAEAAPHRVTPVVAVDVPLPSPSAASDGEKPVIPRMKPRTVTVDDDPEITALQAQHAEFVMALQTERTEALAEKDREIASLKQIVLRSLDMAEGRS